MARERQDDELGALLGRALDSDLDAPVDTAGLVAGAHRGARRIRRRRRVGVAAVAVLAVAGVPIGQDLLLPPEQPVQVAATPVQEESPPPAALSLPPASDATAGALAEPATPSVTPPARVDGRVVVPLDAMLGLDAARAEVAEAGAGTLGSWTADSGVGGTGWPQRVPCSDGPDDGEVARTEGLRELGSDDGDGATLYTTVAVYRPGEADDAWQQIAEAIAEGTCEGGLLARPVPADQDDVLMGTSEDGTIAIALRRVGQVVVSVRLYSATGADIEGLTRRLLDLATERLHASGFAASLEADAGG